MERSFRVGIHDFLNSRPLTRRLLDGSFRAPLELTLAAPAALAEKIRFAELDIAMIPSIEYARLDRVKIMRGYCIASQGAVKTVKLYARVDLERIGSIATDPMSRSSVAMTKILFHRMGLRAPRFFSAGDKGFDEVLRIADAGLVIGDRAFELDDEGCAYKTFDLGLLWSDSSRARRFTHALFVIRDDHSLKGAAARGAIEALYSAIEAGLEERAEIVREESERSNLSIEELDDYLNNRIRYRLNEEEIEGLSYFLSEAARLGIAPRRALEFYDDSF